MNKNEFKLGRMNLEVVGCALLTYGTSAEAKKENYLIGYSLKPVVYL